MLKEFSEPAWNNPVVRIIDIEKKDIIPRINGVYKASGIAKSVLAAIDKAGIVLGDDARAILKKVADGKEVSEADAQAFRDATSNKITRELANSLKSSVSAYESAEFGKAFELAVKVRDDEGSDEAEKADAAYLVRLIEGRWAGLKAKTERLKTEREYLRLFGAVDESEKQFKGMPGAEAFFDAYSELKKDKQVKAEVKALEKLAKLEEKLGEADSDRER
ncbi:MAG: hypothetical protein KDB29_09200 [Planctomycetes bacterium]|nr:hypothetical protein [Planctomycetota bacterium]